MEYTVRKRKLARDYDAQISEIERGYRPSLFFTDSNARGTAGSRSGPRQDCPDLDMGSRVPPRALGTRPQHDRLRRQPSSELEHVSHPLDVKLVQTCLVSRPRRSSALCIVDWRHCRSKPIKGQALGHRSCLVSLAPRVGPLTLSVSYAKRPVRQVEPRCGELSCVNLALPLTKSPASFSTSAAGSARIGSDLS
jgi:hypothetical protein